MQPARIHRTLWGKYHKSHCLSPCLPMQETQVRSLGQEISPREGNGNPLQDSCLDNPMDREARWVTAQGITRSQTRPNIHSHTCHFSILGWRGGWLCFPSSSLPELHPLIQFTHTPESPSSYNKTLYYKNYSQCLFSWSRNQTNSQEGTFILPSFLKDNFTGY